MMNFASDEQQEALRIVSKWLNEETPETPRFAIATLCAALCETQFEARKLWCEIEYCKTDYTYLLTITDDKAGLHDWLRMRITRAGAALTPNV